MMHRIVLIVLVLTPASAFGQWKKIAGPVCAETPTDITGATMLVGFSRGPQSASVELPSGWEAIDHIYAGGNRLASYWRTLPEEFRGRGYRVEAKSAKPGVTFCYYAFSGQDTLFPLVRNEQHSGRHATEKPMHINHSDALVLSAEMGGKTKASGFDAVIDPSTLGTGFKVDAELTNEDPTWTGAAAVTTLVFRSHQSIDRIGRMGQDACSVTAATTALSDVANAVFSSQQGDVICLPSSGGVATTWLSPLFGPDGGFSGRELRGAGVLPAMGSPGQTSLYLGFNPAYTDLLPDGTVSGADRSGILNIWTSNSYPTVVDGIFFGMDQNSGSPSDGLINIGADRQDLGFAEPIIFHHNNYLIDNRCANPVIHKLWVRSAILYRNEGWSFPYDRSTVTPQNPNGAGCGTGGGHDNTNIEFAQPYINRATNAQIWAAPQTRGDQDTNGLNNIYVENNILHGFMSVDCGEACRLVWRFNFQDSASLSSHGADSNVNGLRHMEVYNNTFVCEATAQLRAWTGWRGGTQMVFSNTFPAAPTPGRNCNPGFTATPTAQLHNIFGLHICVGVNRPGVPGSYPGNYPILHQIGWGWNNNTDALHPLISAPANQSGQQALEPDYEANNTYGPGTSPWTVTDLDQSCQAMAVSASAKAMGSSITIGNFLSQNQWALVDFSDQVGGTAPTISNTCSEGGANQAQTWTPIQGGTNANGLRLSAWIAHMSRDCYMSVTVTFDASSAARSVALVQLRGLDTMAVDQNPPVVMHNATNVFGSPAIPTALTPTSGGEIILHYAALSVPSIDPTYDPNLLGPTNHDLQPRGGSGLYSDYPAAQCSPSSCGPVGYLISRNGTSGGAGPDATTYVNRRNWPGGGTLAAGEMWMQDYSGTGDSINGIIAFRAGTNASGVSPCSGVDPGGYYVGRPQPASCLDNRILDYFQTKREYFVEALNDGGASHGPRSMRPACTVAGQGYWATDQGTWNKATTVQGVLDRCIAPGTPGTWEDGWYTPKDYPHPLANIVAGGDVNAWAQQPLNTQQGAQFAQTIEGTVYPPAADSLTISLDPASANCPLSPTPTVTTTADSTGRWQFPGLGLQPGTPVTGCRLRVHNNTRTMEDIQSNLFTMQGLIAFSQQPTNTLQGAIMTPNVAVALTPPAPGATLTASVSGACRFNSQPSVSTNGTTFPALTATTLGEGCTVQVANMSNAAYLPVTSQPFNVDSALSFGSDFTAAANPQGYGAYAPVCRSGVPTVTGLLNGITVLVNVPQFATNAIWVALYTDSGANSPQAWIAQSATSTFIENNTGVGANIKQLISMPLTPVQAGTKYWLCAFDVYFTAGFLFSNETGNGMQQSTGGEFLNPFVSGPLGIMNQGFFLSGNYVPPPAPVLSFIQQPTDTVVPGTGQRGNIMPAMAVQITPGAADVLEASLESGTCVLQPMAGGVYTTTADGSGLATFTGLGVQAATLPATCQIRIHNTTNTAVADIVSAVFTVTMAQTPTMQLVGTPPTYIAQGAFAQGGPGWGSNPFTVQITPPSADNLTISISAGNGGTGWIGCTGTAGLTATANASGLATFPNFRVTCAGPFPQVVTFAILNSTNPAVMRLNPTFTIYGEVSLGDDPGTGTYAEVQLLGPTCASGTPATSGTLTAISPYFGGTSGVAPVTAAIYSSSTVGSPLVPVQLLGQAAMADWGTSAASTAVRINMPPVPVFGGTQYWLCVWSNSAIPALLMRQPLSGAGRLQDNPIPTFPNFSNTFVNSTTSPTMNYGYLISGTYVENPAMLSFTTQPTNITPGGMFNPTLVVHSSPAITVGSVTLVPNGCGITLASATANWDASGNATFPALQANGTGTGCTLSTNVTGATNATSNVFQVTTAPTLAWTTQPMDTVTGVLMAPFAVTTTPASMDSIGIEIEAGNCQIAGGSTTTVTANASGVATFSNVTVTATTPPQTCSFKSYNNTHPSFVFYSAPFNVTDVLPPPTLVFTSEPHSTQTGQVMAPFVVSAVQITRRGILITRSGTVTLTANPGCGATFTNLTAVLNGSGNGSATFNMVGTSGTGTNCYFTAAMAGATAGTSAAFDITAQPPPAVIRVSVPRGLP